MTDDELRREFQSLKNYMMEVRSEAIRRFDDIDQRLDTLASAVSGIDVRLPVLTRAVIAMESRGYKQHDADGLRDAKIAELEARIRKLEGAA